MKETPFNLDFEDTDDTFAIKDILLKYLRYWPWFILAIIIGIGLGVVYMRYAPIIYQSTAKIKIIDESQEVDIASEAMSLLGGGSKINLENEIEILKSYRILSQVVNELQLDISFYEVGNIKTSRIWAPPFQITKHIDADSLGRAKPYIIKLSEKGIRITDADKKTYTSNINEPGQSVEGLPFDIQMVPGIDPVFYEGITYKAVLNPLKSTVLQLVKDIKVETTSKNSEILSLTLESESMDLNEAIINTLIEKFNQDGVLDRQLVSQRTLNFIDERFLYLGQELDSIEGGKEVFKRSNSLSYIEADAGMSLQRKSETEEQVIQLENQISISQILKETVVNQSNFGLLPANIGIENSSLNNLVVGYNEMSLEREKLLPSMGSDHPTLQNLNGQLERAKVNIIKSVNIYGTQLKNSLQQLKREENRAGSVFSRLPEKEKMLRSIERQQSIKENLFLLLLQKREEAAISYAVTAPTVKVVDYALTNDIPISPKKTIVYAVSLLAGMFIPFALLYIRFTLDTKVHDRSDIERLKADIPIIAEVPFIKGKKGFDGPNDRSILAESFRIGCTNVNYMLPKNDKGQAQVVFVTSGVKGEGKTLVAYNLSLAYASMKKRVLLIGADLRNPALNDHFDSKKSIGLSDYLSDPTMDWSAIIRDGSMNGDYHKVCFSGAIPPNAAELLSGDGFGDFIAKAKADFDYIIVDTAPTLLVTDTLLISEYADLTLFVVRAGFTDKRVIEFAKNLDATKKLHHMAFVLNNVGLGNSKNYNYGYGYGYGAKK
ncbi:polysaccharide biosynthesis tyrosine autokinase [Maribacter sp. ANRC-HE7]|uniref:Polysaccharide biosynthesis tyrosine autokinase n=1 Tax=Maribacter aquimaris TaxID=2737171 RepID=A0ABR7UZS1_9FLAO|nr:tyrosine-protein kinase family protein [Maribacter aquimaris]MBD0778089.1 polysaccharide biosynthesis tyrosine autokinase [Maribacter aquimaris]